VSDTELLWPTITKDPADTFPVTLSLWARCANFWAPNEEYDLGDFAWPNVTVVGGKIVKGATGYVLECTQPGRSGSKEPKAAPVADQVLASLDGSVQWTWRVGSLQGITPITAASIASVDPSDLVTSAASVNEGTKILIDYSGGTDGTDYEVAIAYTIAGRSRVGRQLVQVRNT
jgi:hypothetical protein